MTQPRCHWHGEPPSYIANVSFELANEPAPPNGVGSTNSLRLLIDENLPESAYAQSAFYYEMPDEIGHGNFEVTAYIRYHYSVTDAPDDNLGLVVMQRNYIKLGEPSGQNGTETHPYYLCWLAMGRDSACNKKWAYGTRAPGMDYDTFPVIPSISWVPDEWYWVKITGNVQTKTYNIEIYDVDGQGHKTIKATIHDIAFMADHQTSSYDRNYVRSFGFGTTGLRDSEADFNAITAIADVDSVGVKSQAIMTLTDDFNLSYSTPLIDTADSEEKGVRLGAGTDYLKTFSETRFGSVESIIKRISGSTIYFESDHGSLVSLMLRKIDAEYSQFSVDGGNNWVLFGTPLPIHFAPSNDSDNCIILETASQIPHIKTTTTTPLHLEPRGDLLLNPDGKISANSKKIEEVANPTNPPDAATKNYVDNIVTLDSAFDNGKEIDGATSLANAMKVGNGTKRFNFHTQTVLGAVHPTLYFTDEFMIIQNDHNTLLTLLFYKDDSTFAKFGLMKNTGAFMLDCTGQFNFSVSNDPTYYAYLLTASQIPHLKSTGHLHLEPAGNLELNPTGSSTVVTGNFDLKTNSAPFLPRRVSQSAQPTPASSELLIWRDSDDNKVYLGYNDPDAGAKKVELA